MSVCLEMREHRDLSVVRFLMRQDLLCDVYNAAVFREETDYLQTEFHLLFSLSSSFFLLYRSF